MTSWQNSKSMKWQVNETADSYDNNW
jgi:hypothetical protein